MKALKQFIDGKRRVVKAGDTLPKDYDDNTLAHYRRLGIIAQPSEKKPAKPSVTKSKK